MIRVKSLVKNFTGNKDNSKIAVDRISFEIPEGYLFTLLGPSGCGKSTTLRMIAGLEEPTDGEIILGDQTVYSKQKGIHIPTNKRPIGIVFQSYAIWPHMTVYENVSFPLTVEKPKPSKALIRERTEKVLEIVGLKDLINRPATDLSGGQQQRVALARALVREPRVLLLDEPLSNLDAKLREQMREEIRMIQQKIGITAVFVTHDQSEALAISDLIMLMKDGKILEFGPPQVIYNRPQTSFGAEFIGVSNRFEGIVEKIEGSVIVMGTEQGKLVCEPNKALTVGERVSAIIRPENIAITRETGMDGAWEGRIVQSIFQGDTWDYKVLVGGKEIRVRSHDKAFFHTGESVTLRPDIKEILLLPEETHDNVTAHLKEGDSVAS